MGRRRGWLERALDSNPVVGFLCAAPPAALVWFFFPDERASLMFDLKIVAVSFALFLPLWIGSSLTWSIQTKLWKRLTIIGCFNVFCALVVVIYFWPDPSLNISFNFMRQDEHGVVFKVNNKGTGDVFIDGIKICKPNQGVAVVDGDLFAPKAHMEWSALQRRLEFGPNSNSMFHCQHETVETAFKLDTPRVITSGRAALIETEPFSYPVLTGSREVFSYKAGKFCGVTIKGTSPDGVFIVARAFDCLDSML